MLRAAGFVAAGLVALLIQRLAPHEKMRGSWRVNGLLWAVNVTVVGFLCGACGFTVAGWAERNGVGLLNQTSVSLRMAIPVTIVVLDVTSYWWHWANHHVGLLWRLHQVHHSDPSFTVSTGVRFHPGEILASLPLRLAAVVLIGAPVLAVLVFEVAFTFATLIEHGDIDLPRKFEDALGHVFITPALHRRHHTKLRPDRDTNFGTVLSAWDRIFGTFVHNDSSVRIETGLPGVASPTISRALTLPLRSTW
jgi:sterol desaturase/sphingolipid hydroxylase (fatty acid hydroxylase superfamily)